MIDTHCHVIKEEMDNYIDIIEECSNKDISMIINGYNNDINKEIISLSNKFNNVYAACGLNYDEVDKFSDKDLSDLEDIIKNNKICAIGEIGLDYYWTKDNKDKQIYFFEKQLELAEKYDLPVIVHARESVQDVYDILKKHNVKGTMHCYSGSLEMAKEFVKIGFYIGIDGPITFKNNNISMIINAVDVNSSIEVIKISKEYDNVYAAIGINYDSIDKASEKI